MLLFAAFGSYYIVTGENLITGQKRDYDNSQVLNASDDKTNTDSTEVPLVEDTPPVNEKFSVFKQVFEKTDEDKSIRLEPTQDGLATVFFRFGYSKDNYNIIVFSEGLDVEGNYYAWLSNSEESLNLGKLEVLDNSTGHKLSYVTKDDILKYNKVVVTKEKKEVNPEDLISENIVYKSDFDLNSVFTSTDSTSVDNSTEQP